MKLGEIRKCGKTEKGKVWVIGTLYLESGIEITEIFSTNLQSEIDTTKTYQVKKVKISRYSKSDRFSILLEF